MESMGEAGEIVLVGQGGQEWVWQRFGRLKPPRFSLVYRRKCARANWRTDTGPRYIHDTTRPDRTVQTYAGGRWMCPKKHKTKTRLQNLVVPNVDLLVCKCWHYGSKISFDILI